MTTSFQTCERARGTTKVKPISHTLKIYQSTATTFLAETPFLIIWTALCKLSNPFPTTIASGAGIYDPAFSPTGQGILPNSFPNKIIPTRRSENLLHRSTLRALRESPNYSRHTLNALDLLDHLKYRCPSSSSNSIKSIKSTNWTFFFEDIELASLSSSRSLVVKYASDVLHNESSTSNKS